MNNFIKKQTKETMNFLGMLITLDPRKEKIFTKWITNLVKRAYLEGKADGIARARKIYEEVYKDEPTIEDIEKSCRGGIV